MAPPSARRTTRRLPHRRSSSLNATTTTVNFVLQPLPGSLQGVVTSAATGTPVAGAVVSLSGGLSLGKSSTTDINGHYAINGIFPGAYTATITQTYYDTLTVPNVAVPINATGTTNFSLTQTPGTIQGTITGNAGAIDGATVTLSNGAVATADASGHYLFATVTPGVYSATAKAATFNNVTTTGIVLPNGGAKTVDFALTPVPGTLQGHGDQRRRHAAGECDGDAVERAVGQDRPERTLFDSVADARDVLGDGDAGQLRRLHRGRHRHRATPRP